MYSVEFILSIIFISNITKVLFQNLILFNWAVVVVVVAVVVVVVVMVKVKLQLRKLLLAAKNTDM